MPHENIYIYSSNGTLEVCPVTGKVDVANSTYDGTDLKPIVRFNLEEQCIFWNIAPQNSDILDVGFWTEGGNYVEPEDHWRLEVVIPMLLEDLADDCLEDGREFPATLTPGELLELVMESRAFGAMPKI